jgi:hypothetical protein
MEKSSMGRSMFNIDPALRTKILAGILLLARLPGIEGSSSPSSLVNPPRGMAFIE